MKKEAGVYVVDSLKNVAAYADYGVNFAKAIEFLTRPNLKGLPVGRYELDGEKAFALVQDATLKEWGSGQPELHHQYYDIQVPLTTEEIIGVARFDAKAAIGDFNDEKDIGFYDGLETTPITVHPGEFMILDPDTCLHAPCRSEGCAGTVVRKIVIKVAK